MTRDAQDGMKLQFPKQLPISTRGAPKSEVRTQFAALCYRMRKDRPEILMVTSRGSRRWILPKGWPEHAMTPAAVALREAWEEAGVRGRVTDHCLGLYSYRKYDLGGRALPCLAMVYPVLVDSLADDYPEAGQRRRKWMRRKKAARRVAEPELAQLIRDFDPRHLRR